MTSAIKDAEQLVIARKKRKLQEIEEVEALDKNSDRSLVKKSKSKKKKKKKKKEQQSNNTSEPISDKNGVAETEITEKQKKTVDPTLNAWNDWGSVSFNGNEARKNKFLKLMGYKGTVQSNEATVHEFSQAKIDKMQQEMLMQFEKSQQLNVMRKKGKKIGLGSI